MEKRLDQLYKTAMILGIIAVVAFIFRSWVIFFIALALFIGDRIWTHVIKAKMPEQTEKKPCHTKRRRCKRTKSICEQVSIWINSEFPNAKWVWAQSDTLKRIALGEDVFVILNSAGGYRRAKVSITDNAVSGIEYMMAPARNVGQMSIMEADESDSTEDSGGNYELMAYEWVEAHIGELNERLNESIGSGKVDYLLTAEELPAPECWESVCNELKRAGVSEAVGVQDGIKIKIK